MKVNLNGPCGMSINDTSYVFFFFFYLFVVVVFFFLLHLVCDKHKSLEFLTVVEWQQTSVFLFILNQSDLRSIHEKWLFLTHTYFFFFLLLLSFTFFFWLSIISKQTKRLLTAILGCLCLRFLFFCCDHFTRFSIPLTSISSMCYLLTIRMKQLAVVFFLRILLSHTWWL